MELRTLPELLTKLRLPPEGHAVGVELGYTQDEQRSPWAKGPGVTFSVTPEEKVILEATGARVTNSFGTLIFAPAWATNLGDTIAGLLTSDTGTLLKGHLPERTAIADEVVKLAKSPEDEKLKISKLMTIAGKVKTATERSSTVQDLAVLLSEVQMIAAQPQA